jgi:hypothetical protein
MIRPLSWFALLPLALGLLAFTLPDPQAQGGGRREKTVLGQQMEAINDAVRTVARGWEANGASPEILAALVSAEKAILVAKGEVPPMLADEADAAKKAAMLADFRKDLNGLLRGFLDLEDALVAGDKAAVEKSLEALSDKKDHGHDEFKPKRGGR